MTRVTSMAKFTRLTASPSVARPNYIASGASKAAALSHTELSADGRNSEHETSRRSMTTSHGPTRVVPNPNRTVPLMQTFFHSSAGRPAVVVAGASPLDFAVLPDMYTDAVAFKDHGVPRVPLLPDNFSPNRAAFFAPETPDAPLPAAQISIIAQHPEKVLSPLTEVEAFGVDGVELKFVHEPAAASAPAGDAMITNVWAGL